MKLFKSLVIGLVLMGSINATEDVKTACSFVAQSKLFTASKTIGSTVLSGTKFVGNFAIKYPITTLIAGLFSMTILPPIIDETSRKMNNLYKKASKTSSDIIKGAACFGAGSLVTILYLIRKGTVTPEQLLAIIRGTSPVVAQ